MSRFNPYILRCSILSSLVLCVIVSSSLELRVSSSAVVETNLRDQARTIEAKTNRGDKGDAGARPRIARQSHGHPISNKEQFKRIKAPSGASSKSVADSKKDISMLSQSSSKKFQARMMQSAPSADQRGQRPQRRSSPIDDSNNNSNNNKQKLSLAPYSDTNWHAHSLEPTFVDQEQGDEMVALASEVEHQQQQQQQQQQLLPHQDQQMKVLPSMNRTFSLSHGDYLRVNQQQQQQQQKSDSTASSGPDDSQLLQQQQQVKERDRAREAHKQQQQLRQQSQMMAVSAAADEYYSDEEDDEDDLPAQLVNKQQNYLLGEQQSRRNYHHQQQQQLGDGGGGDQKKAPISAPSSPPSEASYNRTETPRANSGPNNNNQQQQQLQIVSSKQDGGGWMPAAQMIANAKVSDFMKAPAKLTTNDDLADDDDQDNDDDNLYRRPAELKVLSSTSMAPSTTTTTTTSTTPTTRRPVAASAAAAGAGGDKLASLFGGRREPMIGSMSRTDMAIEYLKNILKSKQSTSNNSSSTLSAAKFDSETIKRKPSDESSRELKSEANNYTSNYGFITLHHEQVPKPVQQVPLQQYPAPDLSANSAGGQAKAYLQEGYFSQGDAKSGSKKNVFLGKQSGQQELPSSPSPIIAPVTAQSMSTTRQPERVFQEYASTSLPVDNRAPIATNNDQQLAQPDGSGPFGSGSYTPELEDFQLNMRKKHQPLEPQPGFHGQTQQLQSVNKQTSIEVPSNMDMMISASEQQPKQQQQQQQQQSQLQMIDPMVQIHQAAYREPPKSAPMSSRFFQMNHMQQLQQQQQQVFQELSDYINSSPDQSSASRGAEFSSVANAPLNPNHQGQPRSPTKPSAPSSSSSPPSPPTSFSDLPQPQVALEAGLRPYNQTQVNNKTDFQPLPLGQHNHRAEQQIKALITKQKPELEQQQQTFNRQEQQPQQSPVVQNQYQQQQQQPSAAQLLPGMISNKLYTNDSPIQVQKEAPTNQPTAESKSQEHQYHGINQQQAFQNQQNYHNAQQQQQQQPTESIGGSIQQQPANQPPKIVSYNYFESPSEAGTSEAELVATNYQLGDALLSSTGGIEQVLSGHELDAIQSQFMTAEHPIVPLANPNNEQASQQPMTGKHSSYQVTEGAVQGHEQSLAGLLDNLRPSGLSPELLQGLQSPQKQSEELLKGLASSEEQFSALAPPSQQSQMYRQEFNQQQQPQHQQYQHQPTPQMKHQMQQFSEQIHGQSSNVSPINIQPAELQQPRQPNSDLFDDKKRATGSMDQKDDRRESSAGDPSKDKKKSLIVYLNHPKATDMPKDINDDSIAPMIDATQPGADPFVIAKEYDGHGLSKDGKHLDVSSLRGLGDSQDAQNKDGLSVVVIGDAYKYKKIVLLISSKSGGLRFIPMVKDMKR